MNCKPARPKIRSSISISPTLTPTTLRIAFLASTPPAWNTASTSPRDLIPIRPAAHYSMGGVRTGLDGPTSLPGLYAAGEAASTGVHGANRLAATPCWKAWSLARAREIKCGRS